MESDSDEFGGLSATTPYLHRTKPFIGEKPNSRRVTNTEAGPSNPNRAQLAGRKTVQNQVYEVDEEDDEIDIQEVEARTIPRGNGKRKESDEDDDEIQEVDPPPRMTRSRGGSRKPSSSTVNGKPTTNGAAKGKAKAIPPKLAAKPAHESMDVDLNDVVEHDVNGTATIANTLNAAIKHNAGRAPKVQSGQQNKDGPIARLEGELRQALSRIEDLTGMFNELCHIRKTEPELLLERMEAQYKMQLQAQETLIENLNAQLARKDPAHRTDQQVFEILTREEANREMQALQAEANECKKRYRDAEKKLKEKDDEISTLQKSKDDLRIELQAEIERGKTMASKLQRLPPASSSRPRTVNGLLSTDDLKVGEIIKFYEDLTNLIVPNMKLQKGKYLGTDEWILNCVYSYVDEGAQNQKSVDSKTISFTLRLCREPPSEFNEIVENERQLVETVHYLPQNLDKESFEFRESLEFLNTSFTFERSQLPLFIRTLHQHMGGDEDSDDSKSEVNVPGAESH